VLSTAARSIYQYKKDTFMAIPARVGLITFEGENYHWIIGFTVILGYLPDDIFTNTRVITPRPVILVAKEPQTLFRINDE
jgi:hypothetical protein